MGIRSCIGAALVAAGVVAVGCGGNRTAFTLAGSTAFQPFAEKLAEHYMGAHPDVVITVQGGGSAVGVQAALSGAAQIGMADLVTLPPEAASLRSIVVARDGIAVVVNPANKVGALTMDQVRRVFCGEIRNWKELGGDDHAIAVVSREAGSGTRSSFEQIVGGVKLSGDAMVQNSNGTIRETVANDAHAIGYLSHGLLNDRIKAVTVDGSACAEDAITSGQYRLVRPIFLLLPAAPAQGCQAFVDYILSAEGQTLIHQNGLIRAR